MILKCIQSERNEAPILVSMDEYFQLLLFNFDEVIEEHEKQVGYNQVAIHKPRGRPSHKVCSSTSLPQDNFNKGM